MNPTRLRVLLIAVLLGVQLATVVAILLSAQREASAVLAAEAETTLARLADQVGEQTRRYLDTAEGVLDTGGQLIADGLLDSLDDDRLERYFGAQLRSQPWLAGMMLGRADGSFVYVSRAGGGLRAKRINLVDGERAVTFVQRDADGGTARVWSDPGDRYDPRERPWYRRARASDAIVWTDPYVFFSSGLPGVSVALTSERPAARSGGAPGTPLDAGVLAVDIDMRVLSAFVAAVPGAGEGSAAIVDATHHVVAYSDPARLRAASGERALPSLPSLPSLGDAPLEALLARRERRREASTPSPRAGEPLRVGERRHLAVARPFPSTFEGSTAGGRWSLLAQIPFEKHSAGLLAMLAGKLHTLVAVLALSALVAVLAVVRLTRPVYGFHRDATIDRLTGACNRGEFERRVRKRLERRRRGEAGDRLVLAVLDLDGFKAINDAFGHAVGDAVLATFVRRLKERLRGSDIVGRSGGDEFALALGVGADDDGTRVVERLRESVVREPIAIGGTRHAFGATAGVARHEPGESVSETLRRADRALVAGKACAKNRSYAAVGPDDGAPIGRGVLGRAPPSILEVALGTVSPGPKRPD